MNEETASPAFERNGTSANGTPGHAEILRVATDVYTRHNEPSLSPSLWLNREEPAFEVKFRIQPDQAHSIAQWASKHLTLDPHADASLGNAYRVHGIYFDTAALDVYHRSPGFKKRKFRLRRYGNGAVIFLEQKRKSAGKVAKRRVHVDPIDLERLQTQLPLEDTWTGHWFHRRIVRRNLAPSCQVSYDREAYFGHNGEGPLRLTMDRGIQCKEPTGLSVEEVVDGLPIGRDDILLELKFRRHVPALFKGLMQEFGLAPSRVSKYRMAIEALGRVPVIRNSADG